MRCLKDPLLLTRRVNFILHVDILTKKCLDAAKLTELAEVQKTFE